MDNALSTNQALHYLLDRERVCRDNSRRKRLLTQAKLRYAKAMPEEIDYSYMRKLNKEQFQGLLCGDWLIKHRNVILIGATGLGKSYLACALGQQMCRLGHRVRYYRVSKLLDDLRIAHGDGSYQQLLMQLARINVLILDDWGIDQLNRSQRTDLLEILEDRAAKQATVITSQLPVSHWHDYIGDPTIADAILERIVHNAYVFNLQGESMRKNHAEVLHVDQADV